MNVPLEALFRCTAGIVPSFIATCAPDGTPNVTVISQITLVDARHVAMSCQFFNKTKRNLLANPLATALLLDPITFEEYRLVLRYVRSETEGPLFDAMSARIQAIASHTGMAGIFSLRSADVCEVLEATKVEAFLAEAPAPAEAPSEAGPLSELRALGIVSSRLNGATDLEDLLDRALTAFDSLFGFRHSMVLMAEDRLGVLVTIASRGYGEIGAGAEVPLGVGFIGTAAERRVPIRITGREALRRYGRAIMDRAREVGDAGTLPPEIPLPGLPDAESQIALPLVVRDQLLGVLAFESRDPLAFADWHESFLSVVANQMAIGIDRFADSPEADPAPLAKANERAGPRGPSGRTFTYFRDDDCVFVDGEYLIRNVPGRILWKLLSAHRDEGRREFTNRELRLDPALGLPAYKDNLESRLILLKRRLEKKCPDVRLVPVCRGRFALELDRPYELRSGR